MKIYDGRDAQGQLHYFEVDNVFLSRSRACRLVESIKGAKIIKRHKAWRIVSDDVFCVFQLGAKTLEIWEPFGDNSRYHVGANPPGWCAELEIVRDAFARYRPFSLPWFGAHAG